MDLSLILPCYNPQKGWERNVADTVHQLTAELANNIQLIIVVDGQSQTVQEAQLDWLKKEVSNILIICYPENRGKGFAIRQGVSKAQSPIIVYTDIDFPYQLTSLMEVFKTLQLNTCDVAVGIKNADYYGHLSPLRRIISRSLQSMTRAFLAMPITDTQCGLKGFNAGVKDVFLATTIDRYLFDLEFVRNCFSRPEIRVLAVPVQLKENVQFRKMNYQILLPEMLNFVKLLVSKPKIK